VVDERVDIDAEGQEVHHTVYSVANLITILRLLLVPFFFTVLISGTERSRLIAVILYAVAASTDWVDGQIARRTHTVTFVGKIIDPLVDRLLLASGVIGLYLIDELPLWIPILLVLRDVYLLYGAYVLESHKLILPVTWLGKATTAVLLTGFTSMIAAWPMVGERVLGLWFVYAGIALSMMTAVQYTIVARRAVADARPAE
jgi:cardiolipin synthase